MLKNVFFFLWMFIFTSTLLGQEISFKAIASKTEVSVNERFAVQFVLTYSQQNISIDRQLKLPNFNGLHQLGESTLNSIQINNGVMTNHSGVEVVLVADHEGEYTIGSATITIDGKRYKTNPIKISVKKGLKPKSEPGKRLQGAFLTSEVSEENPFLNQEVILTVKLYARDYSILNRIRNYQEPDFSNLIAKFVSEKTSDNVRQELVNGQTFVSQELARYVIFPQKTGVIEIDPFSINVLLSGYYGAENVQLTSEPIRLNVKNLPAGKPKNFSGAVGTYNLNATLSKKETKANEAVNLEVEIIGAGNLNTLKTPKIEIPEHIEAFDPKKKDVIEIRPSGMKGKVVENHILVPSYGGLYKIGPVEFNYFDTEQKKYITLSTKPFTLEVDGPKPPSAQDSAKQTLNDHVRTDTTSNFNPVIVPQKISEVKDQVVETVAKDNNWMWVLGGLLVLVGGGYFWANHKKSNSQIKTVSDKQRKNQFKAGINSKLAELKSLAQKGDRAAFLSLQEDILTQIGMHFSHTSLADFTENSVAEKLKTNYNDLADQWKSLFLKCKEAKYAYFGSYTDLEEKYKATEMLWKKFQN